MLKRISNGLLSPKDVIIYAHDSFWKMTLYMLILIVLMIVPTFVNSLKNITISSDKRVEVINSFVDEDIPFIIENGVLKNKDGNNDFVYSKNNVLGMKLGVTEDIKNFVASFTTYSIVFTSDGIYLSVASVTTRIAKYQDFAKLTNLDLSLASSNQNVEFWNTIFASSEEVINSYKPLTVVVSVIYGIIQSLIWLLILSLMMAFLSKFRSLNYITFKEELNFSIYNLTPFVFCYIFASLFNFSILFYIGYILMVVYNVITINSSIKSRIQVNKGDNENEL